MPGTLPPGHQPPTDFTPVRGVEISAWDRFWYEWIEPTRADVWMPFLLALLAAWLAYRHRQRLKAAALPIGWGAQRATARALPMWREIAVIGLLAFIAWRLT